MRTRYNAVLVSSVLFTVTFLLLLPPSWSNAQAGHNKAALASMGPELASYAVLLGQCGAASLGIIVVALILIWKGYYKKLQWTWVVMLVIVFGWYFPQFLMPSLKFLRGFDLLKWLSSLVHLSAWSYNPPVWAVIFLLMLTALILPLRVFFPASTQRADRTRVS